MKRTTPFSSAVSLLVTLACLAATPQAFGQPASRESEVQTLRDEMKRMREDYEQRLQQMEQRLKELEVRPPAPAPARLTAPPAATPPLAASPADAAIRREFQPTTVPQERSAFLGQDSPLANRMNQMLEGFLDTSGSYFRAGYGLNDKGGVQQPFQAPGAGAKYRLGNETEQYGELVFARNFYKPKAFTGAEASQSGVPDESLFDGPIVRFQGRLALYGPYESGQLDVQMPELWGSIGNVIAANPSTKFWAGPRFYRRYQSHINDFWFLNMSGLGGGVEDIQTPLGHVALAWLGNTSADATYASFYPSNPTTPAGLSKNSLDLRLYDIAWGARQKGEFVFTYSWAQGATDARTNLSNQTVASSGGPAFMYLHTSEDLLVEDGLNQLSLQVGFGPGKTFTSGFEKIQWTDGRYYIVPPQEDSWRFRATEHFTVQLGEHFSLQPVGVYQFTDYRDLGGQQQWVSAGLRPILHFNQYLSLALEGGVDWVDWSTPAGGLRDYLTKITLAPQVSIGNRFFSRPVIRAYVTYAHWGNGFQGYVGGSDYQDNTQGWSCGVQMETWW